MHELKRTVLPMVFFAACVAAPVAGRAQTTSGTAAAPPARVQWTPDGTAIQIQPTDPALATGGAPFAVPAVVKPDPALVRSVIRTSDQVLKALSEKSDANDTQYYRDGVWYFTPLVNSCDVGPAGLAAVLWKYRETHAETMDAAAQARQSWLHQIAVDTFNHYIDSGHADTGRLKNPGSHDVFYYVEFVRSYLILRDSLDAATRQKWLAVMRTEVSALQRSGDMPNPAKTGWQRTDGWYVNGNVDLCHAAWIYLVWQATGEPQYKDYFETCWRHVLLPDQKRWKGYGMFFLKPPSRPDGSDGAGYITENNDNAPGFDKEYGMFQLGLAAGLYLHSRDPRVLRVTNLLYNVLEPHLDKQTMILDAAYGSRHSCIRPLLSCGPEILTWLGGRRDFLPLEDHLHKALFPYFLAAATKNSNDPGAYRATGGELGMILEAAMIAETEAGKK